MAEIVLMNAWRKRHDRKVQASSRLGVDRDNLSLAGEIVMFTGIRYERFDDRMDRKAENHAVRAD